MTEEERQQVDGVLSEELKTADDETTVRVITGSFNGDVWPRPDEVARLRIENRLVRSIREGRYDRNLKRCRGGALATWATRLFPYFSLKQEVLHAISDKLGSNSDEEEDYVFMYLSSHLSSLSNQMPPAIDRTFRNKLKAGNPRFHDALLLGDTWDSKTWTPDLTKAYEGFKAAEPLMIRCPTMTFRSSIVCVQPE